MGRAARLSAPLIAVVIILLACTFPGTTFGIPAAPRGAQPEDRTLSPYFFVKSEDRSVDQLPLKETGAQVNISGIIADVTVNQVYKNQGTKTLEAVYVFPASTRAAVYGMKMTIGTRIIEARIGKREEARRAYEQAKDQGKTASLLEQQRPNVFQMNVANIMPGDEVKVELRYTELIVPADGVYEFVYPTVVGPRYSNMPEAGAAESERWVQNPYLRQTQSPHYGFIINAVVSAGTPIRELACPSHKVKVNYEGPSLARIDLDKSEREGGNRDYILRYRLDGNRLQSGILLYQGEKENFFLLTAQPPKRAKANQLLDREYIFVVDVSGSMWGYPLDVSKTLMKDLLGALRANDLFNVILFSGGSSIMARQSVPATPDNITRAIGLIDRQAGGGGTELLPALKQALNVKKQERYSRTIVVVTDGFVHVEEEAFDLIRTNLGKANMFTFGIGTSVNRHLIEGMAKVGMGEPFVITRPEEASAKAARFRAVVESPVLTDVKVAFEGFDAYDVEPPHIPDVLSERPMTLFGKYRGKAQGKITVTGTSAAGTYRETIDVQKAGPLPAHAALRYLWARHRIALLSDYNKLRTDDARTKEVTDLGIRYSLLTPYTSFVAIDSEIRAKNGKGVTVKQPLPLPQGVSDYAVGESAGAGLPALAYAPSPGGFGGGGFHSKGSVKMDTSMDGVKAGGWSGKVPDKSGRTVEEKSSRGGAETGAGSTMTVGDIKISGSLSGLAVSWAAGEQVKGLEKYYRGPASQTRLIVRLTVRADGTVKTVKALEDASHWDNALFLRLERWVFPATGDGKEASVTLTFWWQK